MNIWDSWLVKKPIAHRGLHNKKFPENSLLSFKNAISMGYAIECDIHLTKDNNVVVFHDRNLERLTGKRGFVDSFNLDELKELKLKDTNEKIPTLQELLKEVDGKQPILIEFKTITKGYKLEKIAYEILRKYNGDFAIQSFNPLCVRWFRKNAPEVYRGQLSSFFKNKKMFFIRKFILRHMLLNVFSKPHFIAYHAVDLLKKQKRISKLPTLTWTIVTNNEKQKVESFADNIIFEGFKPNNK